MLNPLNLSNLFSSKGPMDFGSDMPMSNATANLSQSLKFADGKTVFNMGPPGYGLYMPLLILGGVAVFYLWKKKR